MAEDKKKNKKSGEETVRNISWVMRNQKLFGSATIVIFLSEATQELQSIIGIRAERPLINP